MSEAQFHLPAGITEADLIDLVDGVALHPSREAAVLAALKAEPRLGLSIKQMREDRAGLTALGELHAPLGLADGIEARLEADAIRSLAHAEEGAADVIPISTMRVETPGIWHHLLESAWPKRLATAASLAIVGSLIYFGGREMLRNGWPTTSSTLAVKPTPAPDIAPPAPHDAPAPIEVAAAPDTPSTAASGPTLIADAAPAEQPITPEQAVALAREGRLVISVRAPRDAASTLKRVETLARSGSRDASWRTLALDGLPTEFALLTAPSMPAPPTHTTPAADPTRPEIGIAAADPAKPHDSVPAVQTPPTPLRPVVKAIYTIELDPRERSITDLLESLRDSSRGSLVQSGTEVVLRKLDQPLERTISLAPEDILWWANQPSAWTRRATVPVVIETLE